MKSGLWRTSSGRQQAWRQKGWSQQSVTARSTAAHGAARAGCQQRMDCEHTPANVHSQSVRRGLRQPCGAVRPPAATARHIAAVAMASRSPSACGLSKSHGIASSRQPLDGSSYAHNTDHCLCMHDSIPSHCGSQDCARFPDRGAEDRQEGAQAAAARRPVVGRVIQSRLATHSQQARGGWRRRLHRWHNSGWSTAAAGSGRHNSCPDLQSLQLMLSRTAAPTVSRLVKQVPCREHCCTCRSILRPNACARDVVTQDCACECSPQRSTGKHTSEQQHQKQSSVPVPRSSLTPVAS